MFKRMLSLFAALCLLISQAHVLLPMAHGSETGGAAPCGHGNHRYYNDLDESCNVCGETRALPVIPGLEEVPLKDQELELIRLINASRMDAGLAPFTAFRELQAAAEDVGTALAAGNEYPNVATLLREYSISYGKELHVRNIFGGGGQGPESVFQFILEIQDNYDFFHGDFRGHIAVSLVGSFWTFIIIEAPQYQSVRVCVPENLTVARGTTLEERSLVALLNNSNGICYLPVAGDSCTGFDPNTLGTQSVGLSVLDVDCAFTLRVAEPGFVHAWDSGTVTKAATETDAGEMTYACTQCGETKSEPVPPLSHDHRFEKSAAVAPTCTEPGYDLLTCACGAVRSQETAAPKGHKPVADKALAPSCTDAGLTEGSHCGVCGLTLESQKRVSPTGHRWMEATCDTQPTCGLCGMRDGLFRAHEYADGACKLCGEAEITNVLGLPMTDQELEVLRIVNRERHAEGLAPLTANRLIQQAAHIRALELTWEFRMDHTRPDGSSGVTALEQVGYPFTSGLENIAAGDGDPEAVMDGWMQSSGHRANILSAGRECIGIGEAEERWVQLFSNIPGYTGISVSVRPDAVYAPGTPIAQMNLIAQLDSPIGPCYLPVDDRWCTGFDPQKEGSQTVTLSVLDLECTFTVTLGTHEHVWVDATCSEPRTCLVCMETDGEPLPHTWEAATCGKPESCRFCAATRGYATGLHNYSGGSCLSCGKMEPHLPDVPLSAVSGDIFLAMSKINHLRMEQGIAPVVMTDQLLNAAQYMAETGFDANGNRVEQDTSQIIWDHGTIFMDGHIKSAVKQSTAGDMVEYLFLSKNAAPLSETAKYTQAGIARDGDNWIVAFVTTLDPFFYRGARVHMLNGQSFSTGTAISEMGIVAQLFTVDRGFHYLALADEMCSGFDPMKEGTQTVTFSCNGVSGSFTVTLTAGEHSWTEATCTEPATCTHCGKTLGKALGHDYRDGTCARCGEADPEAIVWGDANNSGDVDYLDAMLVLRHAVKLITLEKDVADRCDVNRSGDVDYLDAMLILRFAVKLLDKLPIAK